jgi:hypothetical protein
MGLEQYLNPTQSKSPACSAAIKKKHILISFQVIFSHCFWRDPDLALHTDARPAKHIFTAFFQLRHDPSIKN